MIEGRGFSVPGAGHRLSVPPNLSTDGQRGDGRSWGNSPENCADNDTINRRATPVRVPTGRHREHRATTRAPVRSRRYGRVGRSTVRVRALWPAVRSTDHAVREVRRIGHDGARVTGGRGFRGTPRHAPHRRTSEGRPRVRRGRVLGTSCSQRGRPRRVVPRGEPTAPRLPPVDVRRHAPVDPDLLRVATGVPGVAPESL